MNWTQTSKKAGLALLLVLSACTAEAPTGTSPTDSKTSLGDLSLPGNQQSQAPATRPDASQARVKNSLRWQISSAREGAPVSTLVGTVHAPLADGYQFPADLTLAIRQAQAFYLEADLDQAAKAAEAALSQAVNQQQDLSTVFSAEALLELSQRLSSKGFPASILPVLKPWFINLLLGSAPEGLIPKELEIMDVLLLKEAQQSVRTLRYLESAAEPLNQMQAVPEAEHIRILKTTLGQSKAQTEQEFVNIFTLYNNGNLAELEKLNAESRAESEAFYQHLIINRNQAWLAKLKPVLESEAVVIAVGSLHLLGTDGLLEQLKQAGFTVKDMNSNSN